MPVADVTVIIEIVAAADDRWLVRVFKNVYGEYRDWLQARRHARELAGEARELGHGVELWDRSTNKRLLCRKAQQCVSLLPSASFDRNRVYRRRSSPTGPESRWKRYGTSRAAIEPGPVRSSVLPGRSA